MKPLNNIFYVSIDTSQDEFIKREDGSTTGLLWLEGSSFSKYQFRNQKATVEIVPDMHDEDYQTIYGTLKHNNPKLQKGDTVYINHFAADKDFEQIIDGKVMFRVLYSQIYVLQRGETLIPLHHYNLVKPIPHTSEFETTDSGIITGMHGHYENVKDANGKDYQKFVNEKYEKGKGFLCYAGQLTKDILGVEDNTKVFLAPKCEYELVINGVLYWRVPVEFILATLS
jgi:hypothetical protein